MNMINRVYLLPGKYRCNAFVQNSNGVHTLYSYNTPVIQYDEKSEKLTRLWSGHSQTTMRHINSFLESFGLPKRDKAWWDKLAVKGW